MRIGIVCYPTYGGSGVLATELGLGLAKRGHQVHFITYRRPARLTHFHENVFYHEVSGEDYPLFEYPPYDTALASKLVDVVKFEKLELLHVHYAIPHATVAYLAKKILLQHGQYLPVVTTLHGTDITLVGSNSTFSPVVEFSINKSDGVTAVSESLKKQTTDIFNIENEIKVIYNFIDFERFRKIDKDHFKKAIAPNGERILAHVSNFRKVKRVEDVIQIFKKVYEKTPSKLLLIGDGPERHNLEELCRKIGLCHEVRFLGKQDAVEELLAVSDLFIMPSASESFGLAALEAMACEVPVISSNAGGLPEVNIHGKTGFMSDVGNVEEMAHFANEIIANEDTLRAFRKNALEHAKTFDISYILPQYEAYYEEILETAVY
ncbi:N-acetyl-alpha-D-glucosaminyl L-malate synthase BshA [Saprospiraceae bacterium]|jgi:N-acetyl-alpha-D-glucosaminyl L-malate synthase BshA|nr:N-acetyl-alpha-D-glucosaminyl L-malate synthase BshA [Bacteroidota bacterium]MDB4727684.1 N-acetyl-alpha-D-glucosaminyl L-malate synthase BshA [Saprospiraceae bacterium]MDF1863466.1 N-acetyl-alpha-D-glucosaminyl L-malate synthase BshA [Saprospiraceae bacterium]